MSFQSAQNKTHGHLLPHRDDNSGTGTRPDRYGYGVGIFFLLMGNLTGTRYYTTAIIIGCEQVKICLFCYIKYDLF
jgi:hypothetical protein